jgi:hypothetical protein
MYTLYTYIPPKKTDVKSICHRSYRSGRYNPEVESLAGKVKEGKTPREAFEAQKARQEDAMCRAPCLQAYRKALHSLTGLCNRWKLHAAVQLMPDDADTANSGSGGEHGPPHLRVPRFGNRRPGCSLQGCIVALCQGLWYKLILLRFEQWSKEVPLPFQRDEVALIVLSIARGQPFTPAQIQKTMFLASDRVSDAFAPNSTYHFYPYDYGPFDPEVYSDVEALERRGLAQINQQPGNRWRTYAASEDGVVEGQRLAEQLTVQQRVMIERIVGLVRRLSFNQLISAIYRAYPEMRVNSVFQD